MDELNDHKYIDSTHNYLNPAHLHGSKTVKINHSIKLDVNNKKRKNILRQMWQLQQDQLQTKGNS